MDTFYTGLPDVDINILSHITDPEILNSAIRTSVYTGSLVNNQLLWYYWLRNKYGNMSLQSNVNYHREWRKSFMDQGFNHNVIVTTRSVQRVNYSLHKRKKIYLTLRDILHASVIDFGKETQEIMDTLLYNLPRECRPLVPEYLPAVINKISTTNFYTLLTDYFGTTTWNDPALSEDINTRRTKLRYNLIKEIIEANNGKIAIYLKFELTHSFADALHDFLHVLQEYPFASMNIYAIIISIAKNAGFKRCADSVINHIIAFSMNPTLLNRLFTDDRPDQKAQIVQVIRRRPLLYSMNDKDMDKMLSFVKYMRIKHNIPLNTMNWHHLCPPLRVLKNIELYLSINKVKNPGFEDSWPPQAKQWAKTVMCTNANDVLDRIKVLYNAGYAPYSQEYVAHLRDYDALEYVMDYMKEKYRDMPWYWKLYAKQIAMASLVNAHVQMLHKWVEFDNLSLIPTKHADKLLGLVCKPNTTAYNRIKNYVLIHETSTYKAQYKITFLIKALFKHNNPLKPSKEGIEKAIDAMVLQKGNDSCIRIMRKAMLKCPSLTSSDPESDAMELV